MNPIWMWYFDRSLNNWDSSTDSSDERLKPRKKQTSEPVVHSHTKKEPLQTAQKTAHESSKLKKKHRHRHRTHAKAPVVTQLPPSTVVEKPIATSITRTPWKTAAYVINGVVFCGGVILLVAGFAGTVSKHSQGGCTDCWNSRDNNDLGLGFGGLGICVLTGIVFCALTLKTNSQPQTQSDV